jgi:hypothetical protein
MAVTFSDMFDEMRIVRAEMRCEVRAAECWPQSGAWNFASCGFRRSVETNGTEAQPIITTFFHVGHSYRM